MSFGSLLKNIRIKNNYKQEDIGNIMGVKKAAVSGYEQDRSKPCYETFIRLCNYFKVDANYFMKDDLTYVDNGITRDEQDVLSSYHILSDSDRRVVDFILGLDFGKVEVDPIQEHKPTIIYRLPVYQQDVAAGSGQLGFEQNPEIQDFCTNNIPQNVSYGVRVKGNSMETDDERNIPDQSIILISTNFNYNDLENEAVVVNINGMLVCKEYSIAEDGHLWLKSRNRAKSNEDRHIYNLDNVKIIGVVVKVINMIIPDI